MTRSLEIVFWALVIGLIVEYDEVSAFLRPKIFKPFGVVRGPLGVPRPLARPGLPWLMASNPNAHDDEAAEQVLEEVVHSPDHVEDILIPELLPSLIGFYNEDGTIQNFYQVEKIPEKTQMRIPAKIPMKVPEKIPEKIPEKTPEKIPKKTQEKTSEEKTSKEKASKEKKLDKSSEEEKPKKSRRKRNLDIPFGHLIDSFEVSTSSDRQVSCDSLDITVPQLTGPSFQGIDNGYLAQFDPCGEIYQSGEAIEPRRAAREVPKMPYRMRQGALRNRYAPFISHDHSIDSSNGKGLRRLKFFTNLKDYEDLIAAESVPADIQALRTQISQSSPPEGTLNFKNALTDYLADDKSSTSNSNPSVSLAEVSEAKPIDVPEPKNVIPIPVEDPKIIPPIDKPKTDINDTDIVVPHEKHSSPGTVINYNFFQIGCGRENNIKRNAQQTCLDVLSQIPHRIDKRKGAPDFELLMEGTSVEEPVIYNEDFITIPVRKMFKSNRCKASGRKLKQWKLQQGFDSEELQVSESQPKPTIVIGSTDCSEEPIRSRGPRDSRYRYSRGDQLPIRLFTPSDAANPLRRAIPLVTDDQTVDSAARRFRPKFGPKMKSRRTSGPPTTTTERPTTTTTPAPTTTVPDSTSRKQRRFRGRPKKSVRNEEYYESEYESAPTEVRPAVAKPTLDKHFKTGKGHWKKTMKSVGQGQRAKNRINEDKWEKIFALTTERNLPRRSIGDSSMWKQSRRDPRWRLKRAQQFKQRRFKGRVAPEPVDPVPINVFTTTTPRPRPESRAERLGRIKPTDPPPQASYHEHLERSQTAPKPTLDDANEERRQRRTRPVSRQSNRPRLGTSSAEIMSMGPPREPIVQSRTGIPPAMQDFIIRQVKEHCVQCGPNEVVKNPKSRSASPARYYSSSRNKSPQVIRPPRTQPPPPPPGLLGMNPLRTIFQMEIFKPWRNLLNGKTSMS